jgi:hypothetical protein
MPSPTFWASSAKASTLKANCALGGSLWGALRVRDGRSGDCEGSGVGIQFQVGLTRLVYQYPIVFVPVIVLNFASFGGDHLLDQ